MSASHCSLAACNPRESSRDTTGMSTLASCDRSSPGLAIAASEGSGGDVGMVRSSVGGTGSEGKGRGTERASAGGVVGNNSSCDGKFPATITHTSPRPTMVIAPAIVLLDDVCSAMMTPYLARMIHEASAASADTRLRRAVSPFSPSTYCTSTPQGFTSPSARLASRLHAFATNLHE